MAVALLTFLAAAALIIVAPGPDTLLVTRNVFRRGRRGGLVTAAGTVTGLALWSVAAALGLSALLGALFVVETALWLLVLVWLVGNGTGVLSRPAVRRWVDRVTGVVLIGFGIRVVADTR
jgi:threonine/homoserine/homoserine lactone efflux protein